MEESQFIVGTSSNIQGEIHVTGAKNHALKIIPSAILSEEPCIIHNIPEIEDVKVMIEIFKAIGGTVERLEKKSYRFDASTINTTTIPEKLAKRLRASIMIIGPLLARFGEAKFPHPGGCVIGKRPIDIFLHGYRQLGAIIEEGQGHYHIKAPKDGLKGNRIVFRRISVTATENLMMTATLAKGKTELIFSAMEPEIPALADFLNERGARITGAGTTHTVIEGVEKLKGGEGTCIPDRIETGTFAALAAATKKPLTIKDCNPSHLEVFWLHLKQMGVEIERTKDTVIVKPPKKLMSIPELVTHEYPGVATDLQSPLVVVLTQSEGVSLVHETIYEGRLLYTDTLNKMGANIIMCDPHRVVIHGPKQLYGGKIVSPDLRAGISLVIASIIAEGESIIDNTYQIKRGYENIIERLQKIGVDIKEINHKCI